MSVICTEQAILCPYLPLYKAAFQNINKGYNDLKQCYSLDYKSDHFNLQTRDSLGDDYLDLSSDVVW